MIFFSSGSSRRWLCSVQLPLLIIVLLASAVASAKKAPGKFNGQTAYEVTKEYVTLAPHRWIGSPDHAKAEEFIK